MGASRFNPYTVMSKDPETVTFRINLSDAEYYETVIADPDAATWFATQIQIEAHNARQRRAARLRREASPPKPVAALKADDPCEP